MGKNFFRDSWHEVMSPNHHRFTLTCQTCQETPGTVTMQWNDPVAGPQSREVPCPTCKGGSYCKVVLQRCNDCYGMGINTDTMYGAQAFGGFTTYLASLGLQSHGCEACSLQKKPNRMGNDVWQLDFKD